MSNFAFKEETSKLSIFKLILSSIISVLISLGLILIFALVIKWFNLADNIIEPVNIVIKILSVSVGVFIITRDGSRGIVKGTLVGAIYSVLCYVIFSLLLGSFAISLTNLWDLLLGVVSGALLGILFVNIKK